VEEEEVVVEQTQENNAGIYKIFFLGRMSGQTTPTQIRSRAGSDISGALPPPRKFNNGWTKQQENLMAEWADKAGCYRWLHDRCEKKFSRHNMFITIPVIVLSTLTGTANFAIDGFVPAGDDQLKKYVQAAIGGVSIFAGILTTLGNFLRFAQGSEAHRVAGIAWGKFQRQIAVELAINPNDRLDCMDFLKICRAELDRLIEQSPPIPDDVIAEFKREFEDKKDVKKPEICDGMEHTNVFRDTATQLRQLSSEAALTLMHKKKLLREEVVPDLGKMIQRVVTEKISDLSGAIIDIYQRQVSPPPSRRNSIVVMNNPMLKTGLNMVDWKRKQKEDSVNTSSDVHIEVVGSPTLLSESRSMTEP
jgi:hypothetical protein